MAATASKPTSTADQPRNLRALGRPLDSRLLLVNRPTLHLNWGHRLLLPTLSGEQVPGTWRGSSSARGAPLCTPGCLALMPQSCFLPSRPLTEGFSQPYRGLQPPVRDPEVWRRGRREPHWHFYTFPSTKASEMARLLGSETAALSHGKGHGTHSTRTEPRLQGLSCYWHVDAGFPSARPAAKPPVPDLRTHGSPDPLTHYGHRETGGWRSAIPALRQDRSQSSDSRHGHLPEPRAEVSEAPRYVMRSPGKSQEPTVPDA